MRRPVIRDWQGVVGDWVAWRGDARMIGVVVKMTRTRTQATVRWHLGDVEWTRRMATRDLTVMATIPMAGGWHVTDTTRERELRAWAAGNQPGSVAD